MGRPKHRMSVSPRYMDGSLVGLTAELDMGKRGGTEYATCQVRNGRVAGFYCSSNDKAVRDKLRSALEANVT